MGINIEGLMEYSKGKREIAIKKVDDAIRTLAINECKINFNTVSKESGVSKGFLYKETSIKTVMIKEFTDDLQTIIDIYSDIPKKTIYTRKKE